MPGPGFIRSVVAPCSPWLVITQTCDVTALSQNLNTWGPHGLTLTSSCFHTCHINAQTDKLSMQEKTLTDRWVHAHIKTHTRSCTCTDSSQGPCLCYKNIHWTESLLSSPLQSYDNHQRDYFSFWRTQPHTDLDSAYTYTVKYFQPIRADKCQVILYERLWSSRALDCTALLQPWKPPELFSRPSQSEIFFKQEESAQPMFCSMPVGLMWSKFNKTCRVTVVKSHWYASVDQLRASLQSICMSTVSFISLLILQNSWQMLCPLY